MTILEFVEKTKETFNIEGEIEIEVYHTETGETTLTYNELNSDVNSYNHWDISYYSCGDVNITFYKQD